MATRKKDLQQVGRKFNQAGTGVAAYKFKWEKWVDEAVSVVISVQWSNVNRPNARTEITLKPPVQDE